MTASAAVPKLPASPRAPATRPGSPSTSTTNASTSEPTRWPPTWPTTPGVLTPAVRAGQCCSPPTNTLVAELNGRPRRPALGSDGWLPVTLGDGLTASVGIDHTRSNARWLRSGDRTWVKNGHRWIIRARRGGRFPDRVAVGRRS